MLIALISAGLLAYAIAGFCTGAHLHDDLGYPNSQAVAGCFIWPWVLYKLHRKGEGLAKVFRELRTKLEQADSGER